MHGEPTPLFGGVSPSSLLDILLRSVHPVAYMQPVGGSPSQPGGGVLCPECLPEAASQ